MTRRRTAGVGRGRLWTSVVVPRASFLAAHGTRRDDPPYGMNLGILLRHRIDLMERFGDLEPAIDCNYMLRMPPGSTITEKDYKVVFKVGSPPSGRVLHEATGKGRPYER